MTIKERLLAKKKREKRIDLDGEQVLCVAVPRDVRAQSLADSRNKRGVLNAPKAENKLLAVGVLDPETRNPVMSESEWSQVPPHISSKAFSAIDWCSGWSEDAGGDDPKDSDSTQS